MDWEDTVSSWERIRVISEKCRKAGKEGMFQTEEQRRDQAEISFKAGYDEALKMHAENYYKAGIREVVEFINDLIIGIDGCKFEERLDGDKGCVVLDMNENQWQAKLKEWGIE